MTESTKPGEQALFSPLSPPSFPEIYETALVAPLFRPWADSLLDDAQLGPGESILDVACGTGIVARVARERLGTAGKVVGVDGSPGMLAVAARVAPAIEWRQGDAAALPLQPEERFDVVVCQQGLQFFEDRAEAAREMKRALAANGRLAVSTWRPDEEFPVLHGLRGVAERHLGPIDDARHSLSDPRAIEAVLQAAGFHSVSSKNLSRTIRFPDGLVFVRLNAMALVTMSERADSMTEDEREKVVAAIVRDSARLVDLHTDGAGFTYEIGANVVLARGSA